MGKLIYPQRPTSSQQKILRLYSTTTLKPLGICEGEVRNPKNGQVYRTTFMVVPSLEAIPLLEAQTAQEMQLVRVEFQNICSTAANKENACNRTKTVRRVGTYSQGEQEQQ